jgi:hypothetical protein
VEIAVSVDWADRDLFWFGLVEEVDEVVFPDSGLGVGAVAVSGVAV